MRFSGLLFFLGCLLAASSSLAQAPARAGDVRDDAGAGVPGIRVPAPRDTLRLATPGALGRFGYLTPRHEPASLVAWRSAERLRQRTDAALRRLWLERTAPTLPLAREPREIVSLPPPELPPASADGGAGPDYADLDLRLGTRLEAKAEQNRNESCLGGQLYNPAFSCRGAYQPQLDFQFNVLSGGVVADRIHVDVDYDTQREFDASNNISVYYQGRPDEILHRVEIGNVSFALPPSRFITRGIPSGNQGIQAIGQLGPMRFRTIFARQKGNVVADRTFVIGDRTLQTVERDIEDFQLEPRRFFFTIDPELLAGYPNIDVLDGQRMLGLAAALPDTVRPVRVLLYRLQLGAPPPNPNGPQFIVRGGDLPQTRGQVYELLREGIDYYIDPSQLWVALVRPLNATNERLVVTYLVSIGGGPEQPYPSTGGTPDVAYTDAPQYANLLWDPTLRPTDPAFRQEIRSAYRLGGEDVQRETVELRVVAGASGEQEKPTGGTAQTYLQMFGLARPTNPNEFDAENRLWPRATDPNYDPAAGGTGARIIRDQFVILPSLRPFASSGLVEPGNPTNDTLYTIPGEYLYSAQRPQAVYRLRTRYATSGGGGADGTLMLGSIQLRQQSERIFIDGVPLVRGVDYTMDYDLGRLSFTRADTLFSRPREVTVQFEENPLFTTQPTSLFGLVAQFPTANGDLNFTVVSQSQATTFTRPPLGFEPASSIIAGVSGALSWDAGVLSRALEALPFTDGAAPATIRLEGEFATSRPRPNDIGLAYVESFEGQGGISIPLAEQNWYLGSRPLAGATLSAATLALDRAATLAWQNLPIDTVTGLPIRYTIDRIDPRVLLAGQGFQSPEQLLWLTLFPLDRGGLRDPETGAERWTIPGAPTGQRWRSVRTSLSPSGLDLTRVEELEFWVRIDTTSFAQARLPTLVFDFGDISENSVAFAPETLYVDRAGAPADSVYGGRRLQRYDALDTERDSLSRTFNAAVNDVGLPGDRIDTLTVVTPTGTVTAFDVPLCVNPFNQLYPIGDTRSTCTVQNNRLDEEDLDGDQVLNMTEAQQPSAEDAVRFIVDLGDPAVRARTGVCDPGSDQCWVLVRAPFLAPDETFNQPDLRRVRAMRVTMISGAGAGDDELTTVPIARLRLVGAPWVKRADVVLEGLAGEREALGGGTILASLIGTTDSTSSLVYQPPPGVVQELETAGGEYGIARTQINEHSLRLQTVNLPLYARAEAFYRFPEGGKNFLGYRQLRVWARGRGNGWGADGELQFFLKIGRDASNFYLYRTPVNAGPDREAWRPEVRVDFDRFLALRARVQNAYLQQAGETMQCEGLDLALLEASGLPAGAGRWAACDDGYIVFTTDPNLSPPNLAGVQELAAGIVRVAEPGGGPFGTLPGDTLEVWVDDIRLAEPEGTPGYAGQVSLAVGAAGLADVRVTVSRRDAHFRQLSEQPSFITDDRIDLVSSIRLDRFLPASLGLALPFTVRHSTTGRDPFFLGGTDLRGRGVDGLRTPKASSTSYTLGIRRTEPVPNPILGAVVDHLALNATWGDADTRHEYGQTGARNWTVGLDYGVAPTARTAPVPEWLRAAIGKLPGWLATSEPLRALGGARVRWTPTQLRFTSTLGRASDRRLAFLKPVSAPDDDPRVTEGLNHLWRNGAVLELRPLSGLAFRWTAASVRDLRDYGDSTLGIAAQAERGALFGMDLGLERERTMATSLTISPPLFAWIRPTFTVGSSYGMVRDPNARTLLLVGEDSTPRLARRLTGQQSLSATSTIDLVRAVSGIVGRGAVMRRLAGAVQPLDVSVTRNLLSAFDATPFSPPLAYQFGIGGIDDFRRVGGRFAASAGVTTTVSAASTVMLPAGLSLVNRYQRLYGTTWTRRLADRQTPVAHATRTFPDVSLRWNWQPRPLRDIIASVGASAGARRTVSNRLVPPLTAGGQAQRTDVAVLQYPVTASVQWALLGGFSTSWGLNVTRREEARPGSVSDGTTHDMSAEVGKAIALPERWDLDSDLRVRLGYQRSQSDRFAISTVSGQSSRLTDNGRTAFNLNADTDLSENLTFSLQGARVVTFDRNYNRRFTQTVFSAVLQLEFFAGALR